MKKLIFVVYSLSLLILTVFSYVFIDQNLFYMHAIFTNFALQNRALTTFIYTTLVIILFFCFWQILLLGRRGMVTQKDIKMLIVFSVVCVFAYPAMLSYDIFNYIATSKVLYLYHENPYIVMPIEFIKEPLLAFMRAPNKIALYGPSWIILSFIPYLSGLGNFILTLFSFKIFVLGFYLLTVNLIWKISKNLLSVIFFAFNPLVIIETLISGHNDMVMIFFALFSFYLLVKKKLIPAVIFLTTSIFIKYATLLLLSVFIYVIYKQKRKDDISWKKIWIASFILMFVAFILSPIREEIYPWYAIWFLAFASLIPKKKFIFYTSVVLSFGLVLRYVPYMFLGTYLSPTPVLKELITFLPVVCYIFYYGFTKIVKKKA